MPHDTPQPYTPGQTAVVWTDYLIGTLPIVGADPAPLIGYVHADEFDGHDNVFDAISAATSARGSSSTCASPIRTRTTGGRKNAVISVERRNTEDESRTGEALPLARGNRPLSTARHESIRYDKLRE